MAEISRAALFGKLNSLAYRAIEAATVFCKHRGNPYVELTHWVHQILTIQDSDLHRIVKQFNLNPSKVAQDLTDALDKLPRGSSTITDLADDLEEAAERAWVYGTLMFKESQVRTGHLIVGMMKTKRLRNALLSISREFEKINADTLTDRFAEVVKGSPEEVLRATDGFTVVGGGAEPGEASGAVAPAQMGRQEALRRFSVDLTERARKGELDNLVGRDDEIRQIIDILMRRRQNNPILTGEAGVGKTAVVESFALRIARGDVPPPLKDVSLRSLDIGLLQAGASMKGEFENRLRQVIEEVQASEKPIILFVDEAHTLIGAGGAAGTGDAANLLKPALARGTLRTIAATTWSEYKKHIEKDPALTRRFQVVMVDEPVEEKAILMMRAMASAMEKHHKVLVLDEALEASVRLSHRYIPARQLPDKSVSLLDTACARVAISLSATPAELEDTIRRIEALEVELGIIDREEAIGIDVTDRRLIANEKLAASKDRRVTLEARFKEEKDLVDRILDIRGELRGTADKVEGTGSKLEAAAEAVKEKEAPPAGITPERRAELSAELKTLLAKLDTVQGDSPLILPSVDSSAVAAVVADWTGIPVGRMVKNEIEAVLKLSETLGQRVVGQRHALDMICRRLQTSRAGLDNPSKPVGVFMLTGPSGVGKTETALALAESMYGGEQNLITINMSEFQEAHTVSTLKGAPPGYVGYGEGGVLTEAVRRKPYSVVLLDEIEKAHKDVHEIFYQVFDKGWMEDGEGRHINFKNCVIILTTNVGTDLIMGMCKDPTLMPDTEALAKACREPLLKAFPPALLGRIVVIPYYPLTDAVIGEIAKLQLSRIQKRVRENHRIPFTYGDDAIKLIIDRCQEVESGARMIDMILTNTMLPTMSERILTRMMEGQPLKKIHVSVEDQEFRYAFE
jgi:type VI secretion system protein VasG